MNAIKKQHTSFAKATAAVTVACSAPGGWAAITFVEDEVSARRAAYARHYHAALVMGKELITRLQVGALRQAQQRKNKLIYQSKCPVLATTPSQVGIQNAFCLFEYLTLRNKHPANNRVAQNTFLSNLKLCTSALPRKPVGGRSLWATLNTTTTRNFNTDA